MFVCLISTSNAQDAEPAKNPSPAEQKQSSLVPNNIIQFPISDPTQSKSGFTCPVVGNYNDLKIYPSFFSQLGTFFPILGLLFTVAVYGTTSVFGYITTCLLDDIVILGTSLVLIISWYSFTKPFWLVLLANLLQGAASKRDALSTFFIAKKAVVIVGSDSGPVGINYTVPIIALGCIFVVTGISSLVTLGILRIDFHKKREILSNPDNKHYRRFYKRIKGIIIWIYFIHSLEVVIYTALQFAYVFKVLLTIQGSGSIGLAAVLRAFNLLTINYLMKFAYFISTTTLITSYYFPNLEVRFIKFVKGIFTKEPVKLSENEKRFYQGFIRKKTFFLATTLSLGQIFFEYYWFCTPPVISTVFNTILTTVLTRAVASFFSNRGIVKYIYKKKKYISKDEAKEAIDGDIQDINEEDIEDKKKVYAQVSIMDIHNVKSFNINKDKYDGSSIINPKKLEKYLVDSTGSYIYVYKKATKEKSNPEENTKEKGSPEENTEEENTSTKNITENDDDEITVDKSVSTGPSPIEEKKNKDTITKKPKSKQYYYVMPVQDSMYFVELEFDKNKIEKKKHAYQNEKNKYIEAKKKYKDILKKENEKENEEEIKKLKEIKDKYEKIKSNYNQILEKEKKEKNVNKYEKIENEYKKVENEYEKSNDSAKEGMKIEYEYKKNEYEYEREKIAYKKKWKEYEEKKKEYEEINDECEKIVGVEKIGGGEKMKEYEKKWEEYQQKKKEYVEIKVEYEKLEGDNKEAKRTEYEGKMKKYEEEMEEYKRKKEEYESKMKAYKKIKYEYEKSKGGDKNKTEHEEKKKEYEKKKKEYEEVIEEYKKIKEDEMKNANDEYENAKKNYEEAMTNYEKAMTNYEKPMKGYLNKIEKDKEVEKKKFYEKRDEYEYKKTKKEYKEKKREYEESKREKDKALAKAMKKPGDGKKKGDEKGEKQSEANKNETELTIQQTIQKEMKEYDDKNKKKNDKIKSEYAKILEKYINAKDKRYEQRKKNIMTETEEKYQKAKKKYINDKKNEIIKKYKDDKPVKIMDEFEQAIVAKHAMEKIEYENKLTEYEKQMDDYDYYSADLDNLYDEYYKIKGELEEKIAKFEYETKKKEYEEMEKENVEDEESYNDAETNKEYENAKKNYDKIYEIKKGEYEKAKKKYEQVMLKIINKYKEAKKEYEKAKGMEMKNIIEEKNERTRKIKEEIKKEIEKIRNDIGCDGIAFHDYTGGSFEKQNEISRFRPNDLEKGLPSPSIKLIRNCEKIEGHVLINILETGFLNYIVYSHRSSKQPGLLKWIKWKYHLGTGKTRSRTEETRIRGADKSGIRETGGAETTTGGAERGTETNRPITLLFNLN
ncbi:1108_t:CDS:2 [Entrophospora sp. SA101]|nr:1108_t:CDS:2 [Entrophospora sp. SA101]